MGYYSKAAFAAITVFARNIVVFSLAVGIGMLIAKIFCDIDPKENYSWISGIWHGMFSFPNYVRNLFNSEIVYKIENGSFMYNVFYAIIAIPEFASITIELIKIVISPILAVIVVVANKRIK